MEGGFLERVGLFREDDWSPTYTLDSFSLVERGIGCGTTRDPPARLLDKKKKKKKTNHRGIRHPSL